MDLFSRFKKDYFNYLLSVILPAIIMGVSIPVLKHLLDARGYGNFAIWYNAILLCTAALTGWITQSILRFSSTSQNRMIFARQAVSIVSVTQLLIFLPVIIAVWYIKGDIVFALLFVLALSVTSIHFSVTAISQAGFLSKKNIFSETIRVFTYMACAIGFLLLTGIPYLYALFTAVILSYLASVLYLGKQVRHSFTQGPIENEILENKRQLAKRFFSYGAPLSIWFVFTFLTSYVDKLFIIGTFGYEVQGNYQAIFDLISRTLVVVISPVTTSLFPLLTLAHKKAETTEIRKILKKIILLELAAFLVVSILYWWFGYSILLDILKTPNTGTYKMMGFMVIAGTFVWLISSVAHKLFELRLQSLFLMGMVATAFAFQLILYIIFQGQNNVLLYPAGYLFSGLLYLILVLFFEWRRSAKTQRQAITDSVIV